MRISKQQAEAIGRSKYEANRNKAWSWDEWQANAPEAIEYMEENEQNTFRDLYFAEFSVRLNIGTDYVVPPVATQNTTHNAMTVHVNSAFTSHSTQQQNLISGTAKNYFVAGHSGTFTATEADAFVSKLREEANHKKHGKRSNINPFDGSVY